MFRCRAEKVGTVATGVVGLAAAVLMSGCTYVTTERATPCNLVEGVPYFLPKRMVRVVVTKDPEKPKMYDAALIEAPPVADPNQAYVALPRRSWFRSDVVDIRTSPNGLLSSVFVSGRPQPAAVGTAFNQASAFVLREAGKDLQNRQIREVQESQQMVQAGLGEVPLKGPVVFETAFDPSAPADIARVNASIANFGLSLSVPEVGLPSAEGPQVASVEKAPGVLLRPVVSRPLQICRMQDGKVISAIAGVAADQSVISNVPLKTGFFSKPSYDVNLREGSPTGYHAERPSEVRGLFNGITDTVGAIANVPAAVVAPLAAALDGRRPPTEENTSYNTGQKGTLSQVGTGLLSSLNRGVSGGVAGAAIEATGGDSSVNLNNTVNPAITFNPNISNDTNVNTGGI